MVLFHTRSDVSLNMKWQSSDGFTVRREKKKKVTLTTEGRVVRKIF